MPAKPVNTSEYLATLTDDKRSVVDEMRKAIHAAVPRSEEYFSYAMPAFSLNGKPFAWVAAWKNHYSFYPVTDHMLATHAAEVEGYETGKGTIRFPASEPVPYALLKKLAKTRIAELIQRGK